MISNWRAEYLWALRGRDKEEKANENLINAFTRLADKRRLNKESLFKDESAFPSRKEPNSGPIIANAQKFQEDLAHAQRGRSQLQTQVDSFERSLKTQKANSEADRLRIVDLSRSLQYATIKLRDKDEELKGKAKLLEDVHDENLSLTLQLNMTEDRNKELRQENQELVDRWMARMGREAEVMNESSEYS